MEEQCLNPSVIYQICERLPFILQDQTHQMGEQGSEKLEKLIEIINKARAKALQDSSRAQQRTIGKPSSQPKSLDTAPPTVRPVPVPTKGGYGTANEENIKHTHQPSNILGK